jgi:hypothetical protein
MQVKYIFKANGPILNVLNQDEQFVGALGGDIQTGTPLLSEAIRGGLGIENTKEVQAWIAGWNTASASFKKK